MAGRGKQTASRRAREITGGVGGWPAGVEEENGSSERSRKGEVMGFREIRSPPPLIMAKTIINSTGVGVDELFGLLGNIN